MLQDIHLAIVYALKDELRPLLREARVETEIHQHASVLSKADYRGVPVVFCRTGVGMANAHEGAEHLLQHFKPSLILSAGCAGATHGDLQPGDFVLPKEIRSETPTDSFKTDDTARSELERLLREERLVYQTNPLVTVWKLAGRAMKEEMGEKGMSALDMETAAVAAIAEKAEIPFVSLRTIFDPLDEELPFTSPYDEDHPVGFLLKNPKMILKIPKYARWNHLCQKNLERILSRFVDCYGR